VSLSDTGGDASAIPAESRIMGGVADTLAERARTLIHTWGTRGTAPRPLPPDLVRAVYLLWVLAFVLKVLGASWDVSWHFKWLRDDLAPPHLLNSAGTALVVALVVAHGWTGRAVDRPALRLQQVGLGIFLVAIPLDVINHRINGLDLTAWSPTHALLYLGTAVILAGVVRGWWIFGSGRARLPVLVVLWLFVLENVWFPAQQQEYGVLAVAAWDRGAPEAEPILLQFAADQIGRPIDRAAVLHFALPTPAWVYPVWLLAAAGLVLVLARWMIGRPWAATAVAGGYVAYRCVAWVALRAVDFPASAVPFALLAVGVAVDVAFLAPLPEWLRPLLGALLVGTAATGTMVVQHEWVSLPPIGPIGLVTGTLLLAALWIAAVLGVRTQAFARWASPH
jgi:hypothetical protein